MPDDPYSLADLARLADVTPRTVRYYVAQGLLPSPEAAGPATRYGEGHLARLRLIRRLQRDHLPLAEIRARLERMGDDEVEAALGDARPGEPAAADVHRRDARVRAGADDEVRRRAALLRPAGTSRQPAPAPLLKRDAARTRGPRRVPDARRAGPPRRSRRAPRRRSPAPAVGRRRRRRRARRQTVDRSTWERLAITPDIEIHVRRPLDRRSNKLVERLARIARDLFDDEP